MIRPSPEFKAPTQEIKHDEEAQFAWWHIPVSVRRFPRIRRDIPNCQAFLQMQDQPELLLPLRWRGDLPEGSSECSLVFGQNKFLPLVLRKDGEEAATITDQKWLMRHKARRFIQGAGPDPNYEPPGFTEGESIVKVKIVSGHKHWWSSPYKIVVPKSGRSNSHFTVSFVE